MKNKITLSAILLLVSCYSYAQGTLNADVKTSLITWTGHAEVGSYAPSGTLNLQSGSLTLRNGDPSTATLTIDMKSMNQKNSGLLEHLKSNDFFDVDKYKTSTLSITKITNGKAYGTLTIKNKTLPFESPITITKTNGMITVNGNTIIDRTAYDITYNSGSFFSGLGDKAIKNTFDIAFNIMFAQK